MSGGNISEEESETSGRGAGKWENRFRKQVEANNLLSDKLRNLRTKASEMIAKLQTAYSLQTTELIKTQVRIAELEQMLGEADGKT